MSEVKGFKLVPASMLLDKETIGVINFHCGDGADGQFGEYSDGHLWVGTVTDDDGKEVYGLHLSTAEYPEEGSSTLIEFDQPEDAAQSELAALRKELEIARGVMASQGETISRVVSERDGTQATSAALREELTTAKESLEREEIRAIGFYESLTAAKQRNAVMTELLVDCGLEFCTSEANEWEIMMREKINTALNPTESGASEVAKRALSLESQRITPARFKCLACGDYHEGSGNLPCPKMSPMSGASE